ncbi:MAG: cupredoxin domain-containing protein [Nitrososphaeraceae archaeon]
MNTNIIAIVAISFMSVGIIWAVGNLTHTTIESKVKTANGVLLIAQDNRFNVTNPTIYASTNLPKKLIILNKDFVRHDFIVDGLGINTSYLSADQSFITAIATKKAGIYEYYCSLHPETMRGKIVIKS